MLLQKDVFGNSCSILPLSFFGEYPNYQEAFVHQLPSSRIYQFSNKFLLIIINESKNYNDVVNSLHKYNFIFGEFCLSRKPSDFKTSIPSKMSFDTIRFALPMSVLNFQYLKESFLSSQSFIKYRINQEIESSNNKFILVTPGEMDNLSSDIKTVNFYYSDSGYVIFEMSIPKQLYGHNSLMFWQLDTFFHRFRNYLNDCLGFEVEDWRNWLLKRVDISYNYHLDSLQEVENTIDYLSDLRIRNRPCIRGSKGINIPYWAFQTRTIKFYSKYHEMLLPKHKKSFDSNIYDIVLENSKNILRFEEEWRSKYLMAKLNLNKVDQITVSKFIDYVINKYDRNEHIINLLGESSMVDKKFSLSETLNCIKQSFRYPSIYSEFVISIIDNGLDKSKDSMSRSTYYDRVRALKSVGIDVSVINERFHHGLETQNNNKPRMDFYKSPISNLTDEEAMFKQSLIETNQETYSLKLKDFLYKDGVRITDYGDQINLIPEEYKVQIFKEFVKQI